MALEQQERSFPFNRLIIEQQMPEGERIFERWKFPVNGTEIEQDVVGRRFRKVKLLIQAHQPGVEGQIALKNWTRMVIQAIEQRMALLLAKHVHAALPDNTPQPGEIDF